MGSEHEVKHSVEKVSPKGTQMDLNSCQKSIEACSGGVSKRDTKKDPLQEQEKWDLGAIYNTLARSDVSKKTAVWVQFWDHLGDKIVEIGLQIGSKKSNEDIHPNLVIVGSILGTILE